MADGQIDPVTDMLPRERVERLFELASDATRADEIERARRYVARARTVAQRHRISLPTRVRRRTCAECDRVLVPGRTARVRTQSGHVVVTCDCGAHARYPYE